VVRELKVRDPSLRIGGIGGDLCRAAGMEILVHSRDLSLMGFSEVLASLRRVLAAMDTCLAWADGVKAEAALLLDFAGFNLRLARKLKARGVRVIYFISPKLWAWQEGRVAKVRKYVDRMLVIFPFEVAWYAARGVKAEYVGNPSLDELRAPPTQDEARTALQLRRETSVVALLPGSRRSEVTRLMDPLMRAAERITLQKPGTRFVIPRASTIPLEWLTPHVEGARARGIQIDVVEGRAPEVVAASDAAVVASGTATLEAALVGTPMVVVYRLGWLNAVIMRLLVKVAWASLVNILVGRELVKELLQSNATPERIADEGLRLLGPETNRAMRVELQQFRQMLGDPGAPERVATIVLDEIRGVC